MLELFQLSKLVKICNSLTVQRGKGAERLSDKRSGGKEEWMGKKRKRKLENERATQEHENNTESTSSSASSIAENEVEQDPSVGPSQEEIPQKSAVITPSLAASLDRNKVPDKAALKTVKQHGVSLRSSISGFTNE